jgi:hypothetical protein
MADAVDAPPEAARPVPAALDPGAAAVAGSPDRDDVGCDGSVDVVRGAHATTNVARATGTAKKARAEEPCGQRAAQGVAGR